MFRCVALGRCVRAVSWPRRLVSCSAPAYNQRHPADPCVEDEQPRHVYQLTGIKTAKQYTLNVLEANQLVPVLGGLPHDASRVLRTEAGFVFDFGAFVLWDASTRHEADLRRALRHAEVCPIQDESLVLQEVDALQCCVRPDSQRPASAGQRRWWIEREVVMLSDSLHSDELLEFRLAISHALALSVQLGIVEKHVDEAKSHVHVLAERGEVTNWRRSKRPHQLALEVCRLRFDASEQPDLNDDGFYWNRPRVEELHLEVLRIQDYNARVRAVMKKLDFCSELVTRLVDEQSTLHNMRLEMIIIFLIGIECAQGLYRVYHSRAGTAPGPSEAS